MLRAHPVFGGIDAGSIRRQHRGMTSNCRRCGAAREARQTAAVNVCEECGAIAREPSPSIPSLAFALLYLSLIAAMIYLGLQPPV